MDKVTVADLRSLWNSRGGDNGGRSNMDAYYWEFGIRNISTHMAAMNIKRHLWVDINEI